MACNRRFTTYERLAPSEIRVVKRDGTSEPFSREKLVAVLERLARDRPITPTACDDLARGLEAEIVDAGVHALASSQVADRLLIRLRELDELMFQRFATNYTGDDGRVRTHAADASPQLDLALPIEAAEPDPLPTPPPPRRRKK